ncbi:autotransporter domain-containing protein [Pseudodesulfovibrio sp.]|uniref:autotransporter domain-containing protein n=1 Tax=Pseudodesulfovibrio sp. TaxID=2035812 RepID=UPI00261749A6|nr:autotransporter domain-containing protein [Pseudodesulfovibrio sp.]MDD3313679.1 autotransporter domain-containing protein [Pseudodesulfovibrio sp.]
MTGRNSLPAVIFPAAALLALLALAGPAGAVELVRPGHLAAGDTYGYGVTASGTVVGDSENAGGNPIAFRWTPDGGMESLGALGGAYSYAYGVSSDGDVVAGTSQDGLGRDRAYCWTRATGMIDLGTFGGADSEAYAVSGDGRVVVGVAVDGANVDQSFHWTTGGGMVLITPLAGGVGSSAYAVNGDGTVVVGVSDTGARDEAYRWTSASGSVGLGVLSSVLFDFSDAYGVNADGSVVVGRSSSANYLYEGFRWTDATGMVGLGTLGGLSSEAYAVSDDGSIVVGMSDNPDGVSEGFVWTSLGMRSLNAMLADAGVDMTGLFIHEAIDVSGDGQTIVGNGYDATGAVATFLIRDAGVTTASALGQSLGELSAVASDISYMAMGTMRGLMDQADHLPEPGAVRFWLTGSLLGDASLPGRDQGGEGGLGISAGLADGLVLGSGLFLGRRSVDTLYGGNQQSNMFGPGAFLSYAPEPTGWRVKLGALYERASLTLDRGYPNGAGSTVASGATKGHVVSLSGHLGWVHPLTPVLAVQPYLEYDLQAMILDAYTETGTPFPVHFKERRDVMNKSRLGAELRCSARDDLDLWTWAAWSHRFETKGPSMSGHLVGLSDFTYGGARIDRDWGEFGGGLKYRPSDRVECYSRATAAVGNDRYAAPDLALTSGVSWAF